MRSITTKLVLAFLTVSLLGTQLMVLFTRWRNAEEFRSFLLDQNRPSIVTTLSGYYQKNGSWQGISNVELAPQPPPDRTQLNHGPFTLVDTTSHIVLAGEGYQVGGMVPATELANGVPIQTDGKTVGTLLISRSAYRVSAQGSNFLNRINLQILLSGLIAMLLASLLAVIFSRNITRPILELTAATQVVSEGKLAHEVPVRSRDEIGQLAASFNRMSADLSRSLNARRQMTADIAHELRTPISIILGHAEAVHDKVLPPSIETFEIIREETERLEHLVDDLRILSMADAGELKLTLRPYSPQKLLHDAQKIYSHQARQKKISIQTKAATDLPEIEIDPERMREVFSNIIENALRYTPQNGHITLSAQLAGDVIRMSVRDSGPGVAADELDRIFERFYRTEASRARDKGGSGLGFAIAKSIVEKHNGRIWAESKSGEGLTIVIELPLSTNPDKS